MIDEAVLRSMSYPRSMLVVIHRADSGEPRVSDDPFAGMPRRLEAIRDVFRRLTRYL